MLSVTVTSAGKSVVCGHVAYPLVLYLIQPHNLCNKVGDGSASYTDSTVQIYSYTFLFKSTLQCHNILPTYNIRSTDHQRASDQQMRLHRFTGTNHNCNLCSCSSFVLVLQSALVLHQLSHVVVDYVNYAHVLYNR